jgi:XTP/dITP diphosphohydrolase
VPHARPRLLLATGNAFKAREIRLMLGALPVKLLTLKDFPGMRPVKEDGRTLEENARKKARACAMAAGIWALADDTGLEVKALGGAPGVRSARYAGPDCDFDKNNRKLLGALKRIPFRERRARFRCVAALASPAGKIVVREGFVDGLITETYAGANGFGYDPVFYLPELGRTLGEMPLEEKCRVSHRARAIAAIKPDLTRWLKVFHARAAA